MPSPPMRRDLLAEVEAERSYCECARKEEPHVCELCGKGFSRLSHVRAHVAAVHERKELHECEHCKKSFSNKSNMKAHIKGAHSELSSLLVSVCI